MPRLDNNEFFREQIEKFGTSPEGVNWGKKESQYKRFEIIVDLIQEIGRHSVVDLGCGFGDFFTYLTEHNKTPGQYLGLDAVEEMVRQATIRVPKCRVLDFLNEEIPEADYIVASGSLNILTYEETFAVISKAFKSSRKAFVFNILSTHADFYEPGYNYFSPSELLSYCMTLTKKVQLRADYMPHDFTIMMEKQAF